MFDSIAET